MKKLITVFIILIVISQTNASDYTYYLGIKGGFSNLSNSALDSSSFPSQQTIGGMIGYRFSDNYIFEFNYMQHELYNDTSGSSKFSFSLDKIYSTAIWKSERYGVLVKKYLTSPDGRIAFLVGLGSGLMNWEVRDALTDTLYNVDGIYDETVDYKATELFFTGAAGIDFSLSPKWVFGLDFQADYMTGAGQEFASSVESDRPNWHMTIGVSLKFLFGGFKKTNWASDENWRRSEPVQIVHNRRSVDSDADGIDDSNDRCLDTPFGAIVDRFGCAEDSDSDGIADGLDHCPNTERTAIGFVDIHGCPVDSDFDGISDYQDKCPKNRIGAHVDLSGCPIDTDADGVPDGIDDCPNTLYGVDVDKNGCIDLSFLAKPLVLNIDYPPGSFEVDPKNRERLKDLARVLKFVDDVRIDINGYTDNIGTTVANKKLSEKRARRVYDYMITLGIDATRMEVYGKGEVDFVASNDTAAGRNKNRRIEILFHK
ncbi:MAG: OmpA family protein [Calditrichaeota bacterium]|nr:MAG: OmpA family protein [Calditrichota bacterium]